MFLGTWNQVINQAGQLPLPSSFHAMLHEGLVVTRGFELCLQVFASTAWQQFAGRIGQLPLGLQQSRSLRRLIFAEAAPLLLDAAGRITLSPHLRAYAGLCEQVVIAGLDTYFEIWSREQWQRVNLTLSGTLDASLTDLQLI